MNDRTNEAVDWSWEAIDVRVGRGDRPDPSPDFELLREHVGFYPARLECYVGEARVQPQPGGFYAGWITPELVGPFKGEPGSEAWLSRVLYPRLKMRGLRRTTTCRCARSC